MRQLVVDLFEPVVPVERLHPSFDQIRTGPGHQACRAMMNEAFAAWANPDRQFVRDFQTDGFDARTWELYLHTTLVDLGITVDTIDSRPDFRCRANGHTLFVEATTANATGNPEPITEVDAYFEALVKSLDDYDEIAIRYGSALLSKQQRHYERLPHVVGHPLVLAIQPFFDVGALMKAEVPLLRYLFGLDLIRQADDGSVTYSDDVLVLHRGATKAVPSGWFTQTGIEHISAVLWSNAGTAAKFNRMGVIAGHGHPEVHIARLGYEFDPDPESLKPIAFNETVGEVDELWSENLVLIHNPAAARPVPHDLFLDVHQIFLRDGALAEKRAPRRVFTQRTLVFQRQP